MSDTHNANTTTNVNVKVAKATKPVVETPYSLTPEQKRKMAIRISDFLACIEQYDTPELQVEWNAKFEKMTNILRGLEPYEEIKFKKIKVNIKEGEPTYKIRFFAPMDMIREAKWTLAHAFDLLHLPQGKTDERFPGALRFAIDAATKEAANEVLKENPFFTHYEVIGEAKIEGRVVTRGE